MYQIKTIAAFIIRIILSLLGIMIFRAVITLGRYRQSATFTLIMIYLIAFLVTWVILGVVERNMNYHVSWVSNKYVLRSIKILECLTLSALCILDCYTSIHLTKPYAGIDTQLAELYKVNDAAVSIMRCIPGTFAARAFYVVVTEMNDFDFNFYDRLLAYDYVFFGIVVLFGLLWQLHVMTVKGAENENNKIQGG